MALQLEMSHEALANRLAQSLEGELHRKILEKLEANVKPMLDEIAHEMAKTLYTAIQTVRDPLRQEVVVVLRIDGVEKAEIRR